MDITPELAELFGAYVGDGTMSVHRGGKGRLLSIAAGKEGREWLNHVANLAYGLALLSGNLAQLENELNENYAPEGIRFKIEDKRSNVLENVTAQDLWAARRVILG